MRHITHAPTKQHIIAVKLLFVLVGVILILVGTTQNGNPVYYGIGVSLISTSLYSLVETTLGIDLKTTLDNVIDYRKQTFDMGLEMVLSQPGDDNFAQLHLDTAHSIEVMYNAGSYFWGSQCEYIKVSIVEYNCKVKVLLANPDDMAWKNENIRKVITAESKDTSSSIHNAIHELENLGKSLPKSTRGRLEIRLFAGVSPSSLIIVDRKYLRHIPHLAYQNNQGVPAFDITSHQTNKALFMKYVAVFCGVWEHADTKTHKTYPETHTRPKRQRPARFLE